MLVSVLRVLFQCAEIEDDADGEEDEVGKPCGHERRHHAVDGERGADCGE